MKKESRKFRRRQDDIDAGLVFAWRTPGGSFSRTLIGILVASGLFATAASVLHVRVPMAELSSAEAAEVVVLDPKDDLSRELIDWARFHSPYPDRWDPSGTGILEGEMRRIDEALAAECAYEPLLLPRMEAVANEVSRGLVELEPFSLPAPRVDVAMPLKARVATSLQAVSEAQGALKERWGTSRIPWGGKNPANLLGVESSFLVGVDPDGRVEFCLVLKGTREEVDSALQSWLREQRLDADLETADLVFDVVVVRFGEAETKLKPEPEQP